MLSDEATWWIFEHLEAQGTGRVRIAVDNGVYEAEFRDENGKITAGKQCPILADALVSLVGALHAT